MSSLLSALNAEQQQAVLATEGPVLILAGAGSGKTRTLTHRIAYLLSSGKAAPEEIMAVTFTNKAAKEMRQRVASLLGGSAPAALGTFHSLGARLLRIHAQATNRSASFTILDTADSEQLVRRVQQELHISPREWSPRTVRQDISRAKNGLVAPDQLADSGDSPRQEVAARVYRRYEQLLVQHDAYDFDDLIGATIRLLQEQTALRTRYQQQWRYLSVDEYQDTNGAQELLLSLLLNAEKNMCVVGDDYQAIYSWRGAKVDHILEFERRYPACTTVYLTQNYRSTAPILNAAQHIIAENHAQKHKKLWTDKAAGTPVQVIALPSDYAEAAWIRQQIEQYIAAGRRAAECVVLYRTNAQSRALEEQFIRHQLPYTIIGGFRFYERREIKDCLALLSWWVNPAATLALRRLATTLLAGIGPKTISKLEEKAVEAGVSLRALLARGEGMSARQQATLAPLLRAYHRQEQHEEASVADILQHLLEQSGYTAAVKKEADGEERWANIEELLNVAASHHDPAAFLEEVALLSDIDSTSNAVDRITCMTLHAAKGLEFPVVFIAGCEEGLLPHSSSWDRPESLEEERRLLYVGMTRAQEVLTLTYAATRSSRGQVTPQLPSRFLRQLPASAVQQAFGPSESAETLDWLHTSPASAADGVTVAFTEVGNFVTHPTFGRGVVIQVAGKLLTCVFPGVGVKTIDSSIVPVSTE